MPDQDIDIYSIFHISTPHVTSASKRALERDVALGEHATAETEGAVQQDQAGEAGPRERLNVDGATHSRSAVLRACYSLAALATFNLHQTGPQIVVEFVPNDDHSTDEISKRLLTALVDFSLREEIEANTSELRTIIWQTAFGETMKVPNE